MDRMRKQKSKSAILLVREKVDGTTRQSQISVSVVSVLGLIILCLAAAAIGQMMYQSLLIEDMRKEAVNNLITINSLTDARDALETENYDLTSKVSILSETVSKKAAAEEERAAELEEISLPGGFPLSGGSSSMEEAADNRLNVIFHAAEGSNVVTAGSGIVEIVSPDENETYGTKVVLDHGNGYKSVYFNKGTPLVKVGENLGKGYIIFQIGAENQDLMYQIFEGEAQINVMDMIEISG